MAGDRGHPLFAASYDLLTRGAERRLFGPLRAIVAGEARGRVLDVGAGTGANFPYFGGGANVAAVEPDPYMLSRARRRAALLGLEVDLRAARAEHLPFADETFDAVVSTLVLCTVDDLAAALSEMRRVCRPGGALRFMEHVRGEGLVGRLHDVATPLWCRVAAGCHPNRRTGEAIERAGFRLEQLERRFMPLGTPLLFGVARRAG